MKLILFLVVLSTIVGCTTKKQDFTKAPEPTPMTQEQHQSIKDEATKSQQERYPLTNKSIKQHQKESDSLLQITLDKAKNNN